MDLNEDYLLAFANHTHVANAIEVRLRVIDHLNVSLWLVIVVVMGILALIGFFMRELASIKRVHRNTVLYPKSLIMLAISAVTAFIIGFGLFDEVKGGLLGSVHFVGMHVEQHIMKFTLMIVQGTLMSTIASGALAERTTLDTLLFFSFVNSCFMFPIGVAWVWSDGWLSYLGFLDNGGASTIHLLAGVSGFIGTFLLGPRIGVFKADKVLEYVKNDKYLDDDAANELL